MPSSICLEAAFCADVANFLQRSLFDQGQGMVCGVLEKQQARWIKFGDEFGTQDFFIEFPAHCNVGAHKRYLMGWRVAS